MTSAANKETVRTICRYCAVCCPVFMDLEDGRVTGLIGDPDDPAYHGYTCKKGRELPGHLYNPARLLSPMRKISDGNHEAVSSEEAITDIAGRLSRIIAESGPNSVAIYAGTYGVQQPVGLMTSSLLKAIGSQMFFNPGPIDQPGKFMAMAYHGKWRGGSPTFPEADTWLFMGTNPLVSKLGGLPTQNPGWHLNQAKKRGVNIVVVDPRRSDIAKHATIHLQPRPGEDPTIMAGMVRLVLEEGLYDSEFVAEHCRSIDTLRKHVAPFTPEYVAERADIPVEDFIAATRLFAAGQQTGANAGTGSNMSPRGTLTEYLLACLLTLCGFRKREGDSVANPGVLVPRSPPRAQAIAPFPAYGYPPFLKGRGLSNSACGLPTSALPDEILLEGEGRVRALICIGGNPMAAWPDQIKTREAMQKLDLLVSLDPKITQTGYYADYVIAPKLAPEIPTMTYDMEELETHLGSWGYPDPYGAYAKALIEPPAGSDLLEDWEFFYRLGKAMGLQLEVATGMHRILEGDAPIVVTPLDMETQPTTDEMFDLVTAGSRIPLDTLRQMEKGDVFPDPDIKVLPREDGCETFLELGAEDMMRQLDEVLAGPVVEDDDDFAFRLVNRRTANTLNSQGRDQAPLVLKHPHNPAYMHPDDISDLDLAAGSLIAITSRRTTIHAVVEVDDNLRRGIVSMSHAYGVDLERANDNPGMPLAVSMGAHTGALASADLDYEEPHTGIPRMSAIPVSLSPA